MQVVLKELCDGSAYARGVFDWVSIAIQAARLVWVSVASVVRQPKK